MIGKKASKIRILTSLMKKFKKPRIKHGFIILEDNLVHVKNGPRFYLISRKDEWREVQRLTGKTKPYNLLGKKFYASQAQTRFVYEIKENYELKVNG